MYVIICTVSFCFLFYSYADYFRVAGVNNIQWQNKICKNTIKIHGKNITSEIWAWAEG
jgi:hypothetical protein